MSDSDIKSAKEWLTFFLKEENDDYGKYYEYSDDLNKCINLGDNTDRLPVFKTVRVYINYMKFLKPNHHEGYTYYHDTTLDKYFKVKYIRMTGWRDPETPCPSVIRGDMTPCTLGLALGIQLCGTCFYQFKTISKEDYEEQQMTPFASN